MSRETDERGILDPNELRKIGATLVALCTDRRRDKRRPCSSCADRAASLDLLADRLPALLAAEAERDKLQKRVEWFESLLPLKHSVSGLPLDVPAWLVFQELGKEVVRLTSRVAELEQDAALGRLLLEVRAWSNATFPKSTPASKAEHLRREAGELCADPSDVEEMADIFSLLAHASDGHDLVGAIKAKFAKNKARTWGEPDAHGVVEHIDAARAQATTEEGGT